VSLQLGCPPPLRIALSFFHRISSCSRGASGDGGVSLNSRKSQSTIRPSRSYGGRSPDAVAAVDDDDEVMAPGFSADRFSDGGIEKTVGFRGAQRLAQVGGVFPAEAHIERAGAGHSHAIAGFAEIVRERRDEAELSAGFRNAQD
jgi:hypothetical protein